MPEDRRHLQHIRTIGLQYVPVDKGDIPVYASVSPSQSVPSPQEIADDIADTGAVASYIMVSSGGQTLYYELTGKQPTDLSFGEICVAYPPGNERIYIKNAVGDIVEFRPYSVDRTSAYMFQKDNGTLVSVGSVCTWEIGYDELKGCGVNPNFASVTMREVGTGKQTVPDVVFDDSAGKVKIDIYSETNIPSGSYRVVITGLNYGA